MFYITTRIHTSNTTENTQFYLTAYWKQT